MIKTLFVLATATIIALLSCQDAAKPGDLFPIYFPGDTSNGQMSATKSQTDWLASAFGVFHYTVRDYLAVTGQTFTNEGDQRESLSIWYIPIATGTFPIDINKPSDSTQYKAVRAFYATSSADGDAAEDDYSVDTLATDNHVEIVKVDTISKDLEGYFTVSFVLTTLGGKQNPLNPDHVKFSNGYFKVKITN